MGRRLAIPAQCRNRNQETDMNAMVQIPESEKYARVISASKAVHWEIE